MALATATPDGAPSVRMVLLKGFDEHGFVFFTGYESRKGRELAANPRAALLFHWDLLGRQVRVEGRLERTRPSETEAYFHTRPRGAQIAALASHQSQVLASREALEARVAELEAGLDDRAPLALEVHRELVRLVDGELRLERFRDRIQVTGTPRPHDRRGDDGLSEHPRERQCRGADPALRCRRCERVEARERLLVTEMQVRLRPRRHP